MKHTFAARVSKELCKFPKHHTQYITHEQFYQSLDRVGQATTGDLQPVVFFQSAFLSVLCDATFAA